MFLSEWTKNIKIIKSQRNYSLCLNVFLCLVVLFILIILMKTANRHTTVLIPAGMTGVAAIGSNEVSDAYLIQWSEFIANLKLNVSHGTIAENQRALLSYVSSKNYGKFKAELIKEQEKIISDDISTVFYPKETIVVDRKKYKTKTRGLLKVYIGEALHESVMVSYELDFDFVNNRLLLKGFSEVQRV